MGFIEGLYYNGITATSLFILFTSLEYISNPDTFRSRMRTYLSDITYWVFDKVISLKMLNDDFVNYVSKRLTTYGKNKYHVYDKTKNFEQVSIDYIFKNDTFKKMDVDDEMYDYDYDKYYIIEKYIYEHKDECFLTPNNTSLLSEIELSNPWIHIDLIIDDVSGIIFDIQDYIKPYLVNGNIFDIDFFDYFTKHSMEISKNTNTEYYKVHILDNECNSHTFIIDNEHALYINDEFGFEYITKKNDDENDRSLESEQQEEEKQKEEQEEEEETVISDTVNGIEKVETKYSNENTIHPEPFPNVSYEDELEPR